MAFRLHDLCKTTRRAKGYGLPRLFPRILDDDRLDARLGIAIRFFETNLGRPRSALDAETLVALFGDPRLARGLVRCLAQAYRYRVRPLADLLGAERAAALAARGLVTPRNLRDLTYAQANREGGFVSPARRATFLRDLVEGLEPHELERSLWLDAPDQAVLVRHGPVPATADVRACYNVQALETVLGTAPESRFALRGDRALVEAVAARHAVQVSVAGDRATFYGRQDAVGSWLRHGTRVARAVLLLLTGGVLGPGTATVQLGEKSYEVRLDAALLHKALPPRCWSAPQATWESLDGVVRALQALRRRGRLAGWHLRWWPEPLVAAEGMLWPELALRHGTTSLGLLPLTAAPQATEATALQTLAKRLSCLILVSPEGAHDGQARPPAVSCDDAALAAHLADHLEERWSGREHNPLPAWFTALTDVVRTAGSLAESDVAQRLDCTEEEVSARLAPLLGALRDVVYIDGFGLCTVTLLEHARLLMHEETGGSVEPVALARLGRRLRSLIGRDEGLHVLIAQLHGAPRPAA